ncbi:hypothetical protein Poly30_25860 [Planctomycetes bacterium Poly30]|uniref:AsmA-like C-terminal domain-containing protein n=1 Tax=Saltatorellus ferox TaxID=2528018 RepID=A0A518ESJ7_9BACT|nr:hypothetical protein Poly30_25860 [Planctomycetes bacterium Poly30]
MLTFASAALFLPLLAPGLTGAPGPARAAAPVRAAVAETAVLALGDMPELAGTALASFEIERPVCKKSGEIFGSVSFLGATSRAMLHPVSTGIDGDGSGWVLAIEASSARLSDLVPPLKSTVAGDLKLRRTAVLLATGNSRVDEATMSPDVAAFYSPYFRSARLMLEVAGGVNVLTRMEAGSGSPLGVALGMLGIETDGVLLQGTILKDASFSELREAHKNESLRERLEESMELRAYLPAVNLGGLPDSFVTGETSLIVGGKPSVGLSFRLVANGGDARRSQSFECRVDVAEARPGVTEVQVLGTALGTWRDALGIRGLHLESPRLLLEVDTAQRIGFGLRGGLAIGARNMALSAKLQLHAVTGAPVGGFFEGRLDSIGSADLVAFVSALGAARGKQPLPACTLPDFELRDLYLKIAPTEGDSDLGTSEGFALRGELHALGRKLAFVDGAISMGGLVPDLTLIGACSDVDLGAVSLKDASVDVRLGATLDQHFRLKGATKLLALSRTVDVNCSLTNLVIDTSEEFKGVYSTAYHLSSPSQGRPAWRVAATVENQLSRTLSEQVSGKARAWAEETERDFARAQRDLDDAKAQVRQLDGSIEAEKKKVLARRDRQGSALRSAQAEVQKLTGEMDKVRATILGNRKTRKAKVDRKKSAADSARKAWQQAISDRKKAPLQKRPKLKIIEAAKFADYQGKLAAWKTSNAGYQALLRVPIEADPRMVALLTAREAATGTLKGAEKMTEVWPIETDPKVAALIAARETALGALNVAKGSVFLGGKAVVGAGKITSWIAKHNGDLFMLDSASFEAELAGYLAGNSVQLDAKARFLGDTKTFRLRVSAGLLKDGALATALWNHLKKELEN